MTGSTPRPNQPAEAPARRHANRRSEHRPLSGYSTGRYPPYVAWGSVVGEQIAHGFRGDGDLCWLCFTPMDDWRHIGPDGRPWGED